MSDFVKEPKKIIIMGEEVLVKDPPVRKVLRIGPALINLIPKMGSVEGEAPEAATARFMELLVDEQAFTAFKVSASACTNKDPDFFDDIGVGDLALLLEAAEEVVNWESLKRLFLKLSKPVTPTTT